MSLRFPLHLWLAGSLLLAGVLHAQSRLAGSEQAWIRIEERSNGTRAARPDQLGQSPAADWASLAAEAKKFREDYPDHPQARTATRIELMARINGEEPEAEISPEVSQAVNGYLRDHQNAVRDRLLLKISFDQSGFRRMGNASPEGQLEAREAHALQLINDFPDQPEGYGYLLSLAKGSERLKARRWAEVLLRSQAPEPFKLGAKRVIERLDLEGQKLHLDGVLDGTTKHVDRPLIIYTWTALDEGVRSLVKYLALNWEADFIGINLDTDPSTAKTLAAHLPGVQHYDGGGLDGPLAQELKVITTSSLYLIRNDGTLVDVNGHRDTLSKLAALAKQKEVQK